MAIQTPYTFEEIAVKIQTTLRDAAALVYVPDNAILVCSVNDKDNIPTFKDYLIRIFPADSGFIQKVPRLGQHFRSVYVVAIELWIKSGSSKAGRLLGGNVSANKGIWEFFQNVSDTLEHNTFSNYIDPYPGSSVQSPVQLSDPEQLLEGVGFIWMGNQDTLQ